MSLALTVLRWTFSTGRAAAFTGPVIGFNLSEEKV